MHPPDLPRVVAEDLTFLRDTWEEQVSDSLLRQSSAVLRRLAVEGDYGRAWRSVGFEREPRVRTMTLDGILRSIPAKRLLYASPGGALLQGAELGQIVIPKALYNLPPDDGSGLNTTQLGLSAFMDAPGAVIRGDLISRRDIVKFVANKLGGAHYDPDRRDSRAFEELDWLMTTRSIARMAFLDKSPLYFDLVSIGQAIAKSPDADRFLNAAGQA